MLEGLSFKFLKSGRREGCEGNFKNNLHCYNRIFKVNLRYLKKKIEWVHPKKPSEIYKLASWHPKNKSDVYLVGEAQKHGVMALINTKKVLDRIKAYDGSEAITFNNCRL